MKKLLFVILIQLFSAGLLKAQTEFRFEHYTSANGLSSNFTKTIEQDQYGLLWIGTIDGLSSFNGYEFTAYSNKENDSTSLSDNSVNDLLVDKSGTLWIATNKGLNKYLQASNSFQRFSCEIASSKNDGQDVVISYIANSPDGTLWLGTDKGICVFDPSNNTFHKPKFENDSLKHFVEAGVIGILFDSAGKLWLGSSLRNGFRLADAKTLEPIDFSPKIKQLYMNSGAVYDFYEDSKGLVWILSEKGLYSYDRKVNDLKRFVRDVRPGDTLTYQALSLLEDQTGRFWVSLAGNPPFYTSFAIVDPASTTFHMYPYVDNDDRGLAWSWASFMYQDKSGIFWVGTSRGLDKLDPLCQQFKLYQQYTNLKYSIFNNIYSIAKDKNIIWLATDGKALMRYNLVTKEFKQMQPDGFDTDAGTYSLLLLDDGTLLLGAPTGLYSYNPANNKCALVLPPPPPRGSGNSEVSSIIKGEGDDVWIGWNAGGITQYNLKTKAQKQFRHSETEATSLCSDQVNYLFRDRKGVLWVGTADGVNTFGGLPGKGLDRLNAEAGTFTHFQHHTNDPASLSNNNVVCIAEDKNSILWIGTRNGGLNRFDPATGKFRRYSKANGLHSNFISSIQIDDSNKVWMSSFTNGLASLNQTTGEIKVYDVSHGLQNLRFNIHASYQAPDGELFFCGVSGFNSFYPSELKSNTTPPRILITGLKINNEPFITDTAIYDTRTIKLQYNQADLRFDFAALNYSQTSKNQYAYRLEGYDKGWIYAGTTRTAKYTNLDPGTYTFSVKGCNSDGVWNEEGAAVTITILPPWWQTWWAYVFYAISLTGAVLGVISYRSKALQRENKLLEGKVEERTSELQQSIENLKATQAQLIQSEKMASLGELTAGVAHEIQNPLNFVNNFSELSQDLLKELNEEIKKGNPDEIKAISFDIKQNLEKINHHGRRAESIVKGMLLHSRQSSGDKTPVDINKMVDEFMRLAYHGLRAKDKSFNAGIKIDYDKSIGMLNLVEQDFGRVILNLTNNAFYSVSKKQTSENYAPSVAVSTKKLDDIVEIRISDNGNGIPKAVLDKIFQPFFTTKPPGQGTGLGLSLSYDVVQAHGGTIRVESVEGEGATFIIQLPLAS